MTENPASGEWPSVPGYEILGELGRGGMGVVFRARQLSTQRLVALKLIRDASLAGPRERARFRIEAEAAARMRHPNIVAIFEIGEQQGRPFFAMELIDGGSLDRHLAGQPQPIAQASELIRTLARAVQHAHERKTLHRDLKPANILLQYAQGHWSMSIPKIADFGLAKRLDSDSTAWTQEGMVLGTAGYMAPEQAAGRTGEIGPAVDVYALGAILYELLTGRPPFKGETWNQILDQVIHDEPTPPTRLRADMPRDLESICLNCLEKEPAARYGGAGKLADDLGRFLEGKAVAVAPLEALQRLARVAARDGYQIVGEIDRGPRSTVYRALCGPVRQVVAVKVFAEGVYNHDAWEARQRRIAEVAATLSHPQVVGIQRSGWWDGAPYLALEYIPQGSLAARLARPPAAVRGRGKSRQAAALRLVEQLAAVVSYLHRQGVVHGNLKPSNVLLAADDIPRLTDLRLAGGLFQGTPCLEGAEPATLGYIAPEVIRNPSVEPLPPVDVYGLGLILYELLTGRPPFVAATTREMLELVVSSDPVPPSRLNDQVTASVDACCLRCLDKNPWRRYSRAYDVFMRMGYLRGEGEEAKWS
jgi:eukaryotic-like serine/threonine-protein kinase